jgi:membrane-associated phospholipid phosphatase
VRTIAFVLALVIATPAFADPTQTDPVPGPKAKNGEPITQELNPYVPWYRGKYGSNRVIHLGITAGLGVAYLLSETVLKPTLSPSECRWCAPPAFDSSVRNALVWQDTSRANLISTLDAYVLAPIVGFGFLIASDSDASWARLIDDTLPVAETIAISQSLTQLIKFSFARQRPYAHFGSTPASGTDDNTSFLSGHSVLGFSITASAGLICHWRGYWTEPYVWTAGIVLSLSTEYFRIGADKHYLSDVVAGGLLGIASGLLVPRLMRRDIKIVPVSNGAALAGSF